MLPEARSRIHSHLQPTYQLAASPVVSLWHGVDLRRVYSQVLGYYLLVPAAARFAAAAASAMSAGGVTPRAP